MSEPGPNKDADLNNQNGCRNGSPNNERCRATPLEQMADKSKKTDPYVARAAERARNKLRDRIFQLYDGWMN